MVHGVGRREKLRVERALALRLRSDLHRRWPTLLVLVLLLGGVAGALMAAAAGARRTASAYPRLLADARTGDAVVGSEDRRAIVQAASDPAVAEAVFVTAFHGTLTGEDGAVIFDCESGGEEISVVASPDPRFGTEVHRLHIVAGRAADPTDPREVVVTRDIASREGVVVGDRIAARLGPLCSSDQDTTLHVTLTVVGVASEPWGVRAELGIPLRPIFGTPALVELADLSAIEQNQGALLRFRDGASLEDLEVSPSVATVWTAVDHAAQVRSGVDSDVTALRLVAALGAVGGLLVLLPVLIRAERGLVSDHDSLRAVGLTDRDLGRLGIGHGLLVGIGALGVAALLSWLLSGLTPVAEARAIELHPGPRLDLAVVVGAGLLLVMVPVVMGLAGRTASALRTVRQRPSLASRIATAGWLSPARSSGLRLAYDGRSGRARSLGYYVAEVVAVATVTAGLTFGAGLGQLQETPRLVGWNWDLAVVTEERSNEVTEYLLAQPEVERASAGTFWSQGVALGRERISTWVVTFGTGPRSVTGTVISGRAAAGPEEIVVHPRLLERLSATIGDSVDLAFMSGAAGAAPVTAPVTIVGTGVLPVDANTFETSAAMTVEGLARFDPGLRPHMVMADLAAPDDVSVVRRRLIASGLVGHDEVVAPDDVDAPPTIVAGLDVAGVERVPETLGGLMAAVGAAVLVYLVVDRVREGRRDLAIHRALGFTQRDVRRTVAFASSAMMLGVLLVGVPLGLAAGCQAWLAYARRLGVKPEAAIGWWEVAFVVVVALVVANLAAVVPGRLAARQRPAVLLRAE